MKRHYFILILNVIACSPAFAQALQYRNFDFEDKAQAVTCSAAERSANKAIILDELKAKEIIITPKEDVDEYTFMTGPFSLTTRE